MSVLFRPLNSATPVSRLLRQVLLFSALDVLFMGFTLAFSFKQGGLHTALYVLALQYVAGTVGFFGAFRLLRDEGDVALKVLRGGVLVMLSSFLLAGLMSQSTWVLAWLVAGGVGRGAAWGGRQWLEMNVTRGEQRESYIALLQSATTLFKLAGPLLAAAVLYRTQESFQALFLAVGSVGLLVTLATKDALPLNVPPVGLTYPVKALVSRAYWTTAPFYLLEGAGSSLRQALFVSGTLTIVGSVAAYGAIDAGASLVASGALAWLARKKVARPSLTRLRYSLALVGVAWLLLLGALKVPALLAGFIAAYALGNPLLLTVKSSLVLKGLTSATGTPQDNALARELLLLSARLAALLLAAGLSSASVSTNMGFLLVVGLVLGLLPLEYRFAKALATAKN